MAKIGEKIRERRASLLGTVGGVTEKPMMDGLTDPNAPTLRMPDPFDPARLEMMKSRTMRKLRGGRMATILTSMLKKRTGTERTSGVDY